HGEFTPGDVPPTVLALGCYVVGLPFAAIDQILIFGFYSRKNTVIPVAVGILQVGVYLTVALSLIGSLGMAGLVLANSAQSVFHALVTGVLLYRVIGGLRGFQVGATALKTGLAALLMGLVSFSLWAVLDTALHPEGLVSKVIVLGVPALAGGALYL